MKKVITVLFLFCILVSSVFAEDLEFTEYATLTPEVNNLNQLDPMIEIKQPVILCKGWPNADFIIEYDTKTKQANLVEYNGLYLHSIFSVYYDGFHKRNYLQAFPTLYHSELFKYNQFYEINRIVENGTPVYTFNVTDPRVDSKRRYISDNTYFETDYYMTVYAYEATSLLINDDTNEVVDFSPEVIMGFGDGFIMTTNLTEEGLMGFSLWKEDGTLVYKDSDFYLSGPISSPIKYHHVVNDSYFCYPYAFINLATFFGTRCPVCLLVIDVNNDTVYISPGQNQLMAIFE